MNRFLLTALLATAATLAGAGAGNAQDNAKPADARPDDAALDDARLIEQGKYIAVLGDCSACHTAPGGQPFAGGLPIASDLGVIFATNVTPDPEHGIGNYTEEEFARAVREGIRPDGTHLYPAMPYPSYNKITDQDIGALYAYMMKGVAPVPNPVPETTLGFPYNQRWGLRLWNFAFDSSPGFEPDPALSAQVNRGAYLVEGLGHCGSCHTPRGIGMQETAYDTSDKNYLSGAVLNGWPVPSLRAGGDTGPGIIGWNEQDIVQYLGGGRNRYGAVGGEMTSAIAHSTSYMTDEDLAAIAAYLKTLDPGEDRMMTTSDDEQAAETTRILTMAKDLTLGQRLYIDNCGACHFVDGQGAPMVFPRLDGASIVTAEASMGLIHTILVGAETPSTDRAPSRLLMPGFAHRLDDAEVAELATFLRGAWHNQADAVTAEEVKAVREKTTAK